MLGGVPHTEGGRGFSLRSTFRRYGLACLLMKTRLSPHACNTRRCTRLLLPSFLFFSRFHQVSEGGVAWVGIGAGVWGGPLLAAFILIICHIEAICRTSL